VRTDSKFITFVVHCTVIRVHREQRIKASVNTRTVRKILQINMN